MPRYLIVIFVAAAACLNTVGCSHAPREPGTDISTVSTSSDPIDRAWEATLERPAEQLGYQTPDRRLNRRPSRTHFQKFPRNPVITIGPHHGYDAGHAEYPSVIEVDGLLWLYYAAFGSGGYWSIAAATSRDGLHWTKLGAVLEPDSTEGAWDGSTIAFPSVLYDADAPPHERFQLYYAAKSDELYRSFGLAFSADGITWRRFCRVLSAGGDDDWDGMQIVDPVVLRLEDGYRMYYCGSRTREGLFKVGMALSQDGKQWVKYPENPVYALQQGQGQGLYTVDVVAVDDQFLLFESTPDGAGFYDIYGVISHDGWSFDSRRRRLVLSASHDSSWDHVMVYGMDVMIRERRAFIWFNGIYRKMVTRGGQIGLARADVGSLLSYLKHEFGPWRLPAP